MDATAVRTRAGHSDSTVKTYRYLRVGVLFLAVFLGASLVIEIAFGTTTWLGSISAYYYTSVRSVFVGTLVAMGVCLVALKGRDEAGEDVMLNLAGMCAPVVALVPTPVGDNTCHLGGPCVPTAFRAGVENNVEALLVVGALAVVAGALTVRKRRHGVDLLGVAAGVGGVVGLALWFALFRGSFLDYAHYVSAVTMFAFIVAVALVNASRVDSFVATGGSLSMLTARQFRAAYRVIAVVMVLTIVAAAVLALTDPWRHWVFVVESVLLVAFSGFWVLQTMQFWKDGAPA